MGVVGTPGGSSRALRLDPFALPVRYATQDDGADGQVRQIEINRERVELRRAVRGIPMKVRVPVEAFRGVSMRLLPTEGNEPASVAVMLEHQDGGLRLPLFVAPEGDDGLVAWKSWSRVLGLPLLVVETDGTLREAFKRIGRVGVEGPKPRRRQRAAVKWRRPKFLMRRKAARLPAAPIVHRGEREIIARN
jgi:hypothetical protein